MFKVECCGSFRKADIYELVTDKKEEYKLLKTFRCPICKQVNTLLEKKTFDGNISYVRFKGRKAEQFLDRQYCNIMFEIKPQVQYCSSNFYLKYSEYGKVKKCFSNLSTLKLGKTKDNFEYIEKGELNDNKRTLIQQHKGQCCGNLS